MTGIQLVVGGLAVWRLSHALVKEDGPRMSFMRLRASLAGRQKRAGGLFDLFSCVYCLSVWIGLLAALGPARDLFSWIGYALAFSGFAMIIERLWNLRPDYGKINQGVIYDSQKPQ